MNLLWHNTWTPFWSQGKGTKHTGLTAQSQKDTYMRPQSECLAMFFNVKAAVSRMCLVTGPSLSSWERKTLMSSTVRHE